MKTKTSPKHLLSMLLVLIMVLTLLPTTAFATGIPLDTPTNLRWNETMAEWDAVDNAAYYDITFYKDSFKTEHTYSSRTSIDLLGLFLKTGTGEYYFEVKACPAADDATHSCSEWSVESQIKEYTPSPLTKPTNLRWNNTVAEWDKVTDATSYMIKVYQDDNYITYFYIDTTSIDLFDTMQQNGPGAYTFDIMALPAKDDPIHSDSKKTDKSSGYIFSSSPLDTPTDLTWNGTVAKWNAVSNAARYSIVISRDEFYVDKVYVDTNSADLLEYMQKYESGRYLFIVIAVPAENDTTHSYSDESDASADYEYSAPQLETATGLTWDGTTAKWNAVTDADSYLITITKNRDQVDVVCANTTSVDFLGVMQANGAGVYEFFVRALPAADDTAHSISDYKYVDGYLEYPPHTITYDANSGENPPATGNVFTAIGHYVNYALAGADSMTYTGNVFLGWTEEPIAYPLTKFDSDPQTISTVSVPDDKIVYAVWGVDSDNNGIWDKYDEYTIHFNVNGGKGSVTDQTTISQKLTALPTATKSGRYSFKGWYTAASGGAKITTSTIFAAETTVYAQWTYTGGGKTTPSTYTLSFNTNGGSAISNISKPSGTTVDLTTYEPTKIDFDFDGWYSDSGLTTKVTSVKLTKNTTVYAKWTAKAVTPEKPFVDVPEDAYYKDAIIWAVDNGITEGTSATTFSPDGICTRAQAAAFLWRASGSPVPTTAAMPFNDVPAGSYYYDAVLWAVEQDIIKGTSETTFSPDMNCSRAHIVTMLWRMEGSKNATASNPFTDVSGNAYYADAVLWAVDEEITAGTSATTFNPDDDCTRAQIITFIYRDMN